MDIDSLPVQLPVVGDFDSEMIMQVRPLAWIYNLKSHLCDKHLGNKTQLDDIWNIIWLIINKFARIYHHFGNFCFVSSRADDTEIVNTTMDFRVSQYPGQVHCNTTYVVKWGIPLCGVYGFNDWIERKTILELYRLWWGFMVSHIHIIHNYD